MGKDLVLAGGGHAHLTVLPNLARYIERGYRVTVIMPSSYQYYSGMGPGMLSEIYRPQEVRQFLNEKSSQEYNLVDVRTPKEYEEKEEKAKKIFDSPQCF